HVVEQVNGVADADQPEDGERHVDEDRAGPWQGQTVVNNKCGAENLPDQFLVRLDMYQVVDEADEKQESAREQDLSPVRDLEREGERNDDDREPDRDAAQHRGRFLVPAIDFGFGNKTEATGERTHQRRQYECQTK